MTSESNDISYILTGCIFYAFGLKWSYDYAKFWVNPRRRIDDEKTRCVDGLRARCETILANHPIEGSLKLVATAIGLAGTIIGGLPDTGIVSAKVVNSTIYLFFAFSGLVDVLNYYFPRNVTHGLTNLALAQSFFVEGFLYLYANVEGNFAVNAILAATVWLTSFTISLELVWPDLKLIRGSSTLLHGGWIAHMVRMHHGPIGYTERIALAFSWHLAAAFAVTLCVVATTRSCMPRIGARDEPPEIPIYDYCHEPNREI